MIVRTGRASALAAGLLCLGIAHAAPPPLAQAEIDNLLSSVAMSNCEFSRNGSWFDAKAAAAHLTAKYRYLLAKDVIRSAEEFIDKAATVSSMSGRPYAVRCDGHEPVPMGQWLRILLSRQRESPPSPPVPETGE